MMNGWMDCRLAVLVYLVEKADPFEHRVEDAEKVLKEIVSTHLFYAGKNKNNHEMLHGRKHGS